MKSLVFEVGSSLLFFLSSCTVEIFPFTAHLIALIQYIQHNVVVVFFLVTYKSSDQNCDL